MNTDWCKNFENRVYIKAEKFTIDIGINSLVSIITGDSSTGKTFMLTMMQILKEVGQDKIIESNIDLDDIIICSNQKDIKNLLRDTDNTIGKTIFIDRYDINYSSELNDFIETSSNRFVIMSHAQYKQLNIHAESFLIIHYSKDTKTFTTEPLINHLNKEYI